MGSQDFLWNWVFVSPTNSCVEVLTPGGVVFGDETFGRQLGWDDIMKVWPSWWSHVLLEEPSEGLLCLHGGLVAKSCPTLCNPPMDCSLPGSSVHGILQQRILEWVAISFSKASFPARKDTVRRWPPGKLLTRTWPFWPLGWGFLASGTLLNCRVSVFCYGSLSRVK